MIKELEKQALRQVADFLFTKSQENIVDMGISDRGFLLGSGIIKEEGDNIIIGYEASYAENINIGTKPHFVSPNELKGWVRRKLGVKNEKEIDKVAFLISRKIKTFGTKPQPFWDSAIEETKIKFR